MEIWGIFLVIAMGALNRMRGDDRWMRGASLNPGELGKPWLPGRALYYVAGLVGVLSLVLLPPLQAAAFGLTYLSWGLLAWGRWFDLGRMPVPIDGTDAYEALIERLSWGSDHAAMLWRHMMIAPGLALIGWLKGDFAVVFLAPLFAGSVVICYEIAWETRPRDPIVLAEVMTGWIWAVILVMLTI